MAKRSFEYGVQNPLEEDFLAADYDGVTWTEQILRVDRPRLWTSETEHARSQGYHQSPEAKGLHRERQVRLLHRDGTAAWNNYVDYVPREIDSPIVDWYVELPKSVSGIIGYILPKREFHSRLRVISMIDQIRGKIASEGLAEALKGFGLIEKIQDQQSNTWIVERNPDRSMRCLKRKGKDPINLAKMPDGTFYILSKERSLIFDKEDVEKMIVKINELYPVREDL